MRKRQTLSAIFFNDFGISFSTSIPSGYAIFEKQSQIVKVVAFESLQRNLVPLGYKAIGRQQAHLLHQIDPLLINRKLHFCHCYNKALLFLGIMQSFSKSFYFNCYIKFKTGFWTLILIIKKSRISLKYKKPDNIIKLELQHRVGFLSNWLF